jgi:hypothetical protein
MQDTIELLEAIGRDASLRHATSEELASVLEQAQASAALLAAAASGDGSQLSHDLGKEPLAPPQSTQAPYREEEEEDEESDVPAQVRRNPS